MLWLSIAASALRSLLSLIEQLTRGVKLSEQTQALVGNYVPDRPWLDVLFQISRIGLALVPVFLVLHFLRRSGEGRFGIGFDLRDWRRDLWRGALLAAGVGGVGLVFYLVAFQLGMNVRIAAAEFAGYEEAVSVAASLVRLVRLHCSTRYRKWSCVCLYSGFWCSWPVTVRTNGW